MGFLSEGRTLNWNESTEERDLVKKHGLIQLANILRTTKTRAPCGYLKWGEELEFTTILMPECNVIGSKLWMGGYSLVTSLNQQEETTAKEPVDLRMNVIKNAWHPEMARHMIEALPSPPHQFGGEMMDGLVLGTEASMAARRAKIQRALPPNVAVASITGHPNMGGYSYGRTKDWIALSTQDDHVEPGSQAGSPYSGSRFIPDSIANPHPRFPCLLANVRSRREGIPVQIFIPLYVDKYTERHPMWRNSLPSQTVNRRLIDHVAGITPNPVKGKIYMDHFAFGMGMSCLQVTCGMPTITMARYVHDQYLVMAPLLLALTAATPAVRGLIADTDTRWSVIEQAVDDRTESECDPASPEFIPTSRYSGSLVYIDACPEEDERRLNNINLPLSQSGYDYLRGEGVDHQLAKHFAWLWMRDPLVIYENRLELDDTKDTDHFENIQSTNWNTVRFKPPPLAQPDMQYRVEMRTPEIQITDFENAAVSCFVATWTRYIMEVRPDIRIPMTYNSFNLETAQGRDAAITARFWWKSNVGDSVEEMLHTDCSCSGFSCQKVRGLQQLTLTDIFTGKDGVLTRLERWMKERALEEKISDAAYSRFSVYMSFMAARAKGEVSTNARYLRNLLLNHSTYRRDSVVQPAMATAMTATCVLLGCGYMRNDVPSLKPHLGRFCKEVSTVFPMNVKVGTKALSSRENCGPYLQCAALKDCNWLAGKLCCNPSLDLCHRHGANTEFKDADRNILQIGGPTNLDGHWNDLLYAQEWQEAHSENEIDPPCLNVETSLEAQGAAECHLPCMGDFIKSPGHKLFLNKFSIENVTRVVSNNNVVIDFDAKDQTKCEAWLDTATEDVHDERRLELERFLRRL